MHACLCYVAQAGAGYLDHAHMAPVLLMSGARHLYAADSKRGHIAEVGIADGAHGGYLAAAYFVVCVWIC